MCGVIGLYGKEDVVKDTIKGLIAIQHRGQDSCGVFSLDSDKVLYKKCKGLVSENNSKTIDDRVINIFSQLRGNIALGHVRYATIGDSKVENAQPFYSDSGVTLCHNGNVTNVPQLKKELSMAVPRRHVNSDCDADILLKVFADELCKNNLGQITTEQIFDSISRVMDRVEGSYSALSMINDVGFAAFRDPYGIKPIVFGKKGSGNNIIYGFASENIAFKALGFEMINNLEPGEAIFIKKQPGDKPPKVYRKRIKHQEHRPCVFEYIYFAHRASTIDNKGVYGVRRDLGRLLAEEWKRISAEKGIEADIVSGVPTTAIVAAQGFSEATGIPYESVLAKNEYIQRSFITSNPGEVVNLKFFPLESVVEGKRIILIDDSIVRGTTSKKIVDMLRKAGAKAVYFGSSSPPIVSPCVYGIDMSVKKDLIAREKSVEEIRQAIGADVLFYQPIENLKRALPEFRRRRVLRKCI